MKLEIGWLPLQKQSNFIYILSILMLSYLFLYYFFLSDLYLIPILPDRENGATILIVFYFYFKPILRQD